MSKSSHYEGATLHCQKLAQADLILVTLEISWLPSSARSTRARERQNLAHYFGLALAALALLLGSASETRAATVTSQITTPTSELDTDKLQCWA